MIIGCKDSQIRLISQLPNIPAVFADKSRKLGRFQVSATFHFWKTGTVIFWIPESDSGHSGAFWVLEPKSHLKKRLKSKSCSCNALLLTGPKPVNFECFNLCSTFRDLPVFHLTIVQKVHSPGITHFGVKMTRKVRKCHGKIGRWNFIWQIWPG